MVKGSGIVAVRISNKAKLITKSFVGCKTQRCLYTMTQTIILPSTATVVNIPKTNACTMSASSSVILWKVAWWLLYSVGSRHHEQKLSSIGCVRRSCEVLQSINPVLALSFLVSDVFSHFIKTAVSFFRLLLYLSDNLLYLASERPGKTANSLHKTCQLCFVGL